MTGLINLSFRLRKELEKELALSEEPVEGEIQTVTNDSEKVNFIGNSNIVINIILIYFKKIQK